MNKISVIIILLVSWILWWVVWYYTKFAQIKPLSEQLDLKSWNTKINWIVSTASSCNWDCTNKSSSSSSTVWWSSWWWGWSTWGGWK